jgi:cytochrome c oxidase subunit II
VLLCSIAAYGYAQGFLGMNASSALYRSWPLVCVVILLSEGCTGTQSALDPAGREAAQIAELFWWMVAGAAAIWVGVVALAFYCMRARPESFNRRRERLLIVYGGAIVPTIVLTILLVFGLSMLPSLVEPAPVGSLRIAVSGELWWWRVRYEQPGGKPVVLANEIHLPVGEPVEFQLESDNVIHSFWIPALGGKVDMIPGRVTRLTLTPTRPGIYRGVCAEYCGPSHAHMKFDVIVQEKEAFLHWLAHQSKPAKPAIEQTAKRGQHLFLAHGCNACHSIRGTSASGVIGPDLTHVGTRLSLAAGTLPNELAQFHHWIAYTNEVKPDAQMPKFAMLPHEDLKALAAYLKSLE